MLSMVTTACSTMDDVKVSHECAGAVTVFVAHLQPGTFSDGSPGYLAKTWNEVVPPNEATVVASIVNMAADDLVRVAVEAAGWEIEHTRSELRDHDGLITLPLEACP